MKNRPSAIKCIKWAIAFASGIAVDVICPFRAPQNALHIIIPVVMSVFYLVCFDVYKSGKEKAFLKLAYIVISAVSETYFTLEAIFLFIFEIITEYGRSESKNQDGQ